jgi:Do/DeqQ family serine protease
MKRFSASAPLMFALVAHITFSSPTIAQQRQAPASKGEVTLSFAPIVKRTIPAVVNVYTKTVIRERQRGGFLEDPFFREFFGNRGLGMPRERVANSLGSGVIVGSDGVIVTNHHVIKGATDIQVVLSDKREYAAKLLISDEKTDLAVLKIETKGETLPSLSFADSDDIEVGDLVLAMGNPFGVGQTVTSGIVSALARTQVGVSDYQFFIQTDAAINPGNSGGALVNMRGELIGINTAIYSRSGGSIGIGFSVPSNMVETVVQSAAAGGRVKRPWLGGDFQDVTADIAESLEMARPEGALVLSLHAESPLRKAGLKRGDVILAVDGRTIENAQELGYRFATAPIGGTRIVEFRRGTKSSQANVQLLAAPETVPADVTKLKGDHPLTSLVVANLSPAVAEELGMPISAEGIAILDVPPGPPQRFFRKGDIIRAVNGTVLQNVKELRGVVGVPSDYWDIALERSGQVFKIRLR